MNLLLPKIRIIDYTAEKCDTCIEYQLIFVVKDEDYFRLIFQEGCSYHNNYKYGYMREIITETFSSLSSAMAAYNSIIASFIDEFHTIELGNTDYWGEWVEDSNGMNITTLEFVYKKIKQLEQENGN